LEIVPVESALRDACANLQQRIEETGASVTNDELPILHVNKIQITQLFQNLIGNALKFQNGEKTLKIHIAYKKTGTAHQFAVEDNGIGIEPQYQAQIFEMFKRLHSSKYPGNGLGLAICKAIVDQHRGKIWVESKPGVGSRFCFEIPDTDSTKA
jgi:chemotaxis family two-component system sensor kinase Cph1